MKASESHKKTIERLSVMVVIAATVKFLFEGGSITIFGHADALTYGLLLTPVLGAHSYVHTQVTKGMDNPDETK